MIPPETYFLKMSSIYVAFPHHYTAHCHSYYKTISFLFQKRFLLKMYLLLLDIITIHLHITFSFNFFTFHIFLNFIPRRHYRQCPFSCFFMSILYLTDKKRAAGKLDLRLLATRLVSLYFLFFKKSNKIYHCSARISNSLST